jgi:bifunctional ADP-heptose synthase (sugar kinase/adenylyltransferase)
MLSTTLLEHILDTIPHRSIGLIGDLFLDRYLDISPEFDEPSIETGKTAYQVTRVRAYPGALGTVMNNLVALGVGHIAPISIIGDDGEGYELRQALAKMTGVDISGVIVAPDRRTPTYTKPMYGTEELHRLDIKNRHATPNELSHAILQKLESMWARFDALLLLDQVSEPNCGVVTTRVRETILQLARQYPQRFVLADSRERISLFNDVCIKPNSSEWDFANRDEYRAVFWTHGERGIRLLEGSRLDEFVPAYPVVGPVDTCGAGDSCSAGIACAMVSGASLINAAAFGNLIASITVQQLGTTGTATPAQVRTRWREVS